MSNQLADEIFKRLGTLENCLFKMTDVIDMANNFDKRMNAVEHELGLIDTNQGNYTEAMLELEFLNRRLSQLSLELEKLKEKQNETTTQVDSSSISHGDCCHHGNP